MLVGYRQRLLEGRQLGDEAGEPLALRRVLDAEEGLEGRLVPVPAVLVDLVGADRRIDQVALEAHPGHVTVEIVVG